MGHSNGPPGSGNRQDEHIVSWLEDRAQSTNTPRDERFTRPQFVWNTQTKTWASNEAHASVGSAAAV